MQNLQGGAGPKCMGLFLYALISIGGIKSGHKQTINGLSEPICGKCQGRYPIQNPLVAIANTVCLAF